MGSKSIKHTAYISEEPGPDLFGLEWMGAFTPAHLFPYLALAFQDNPDLPEILALSIEDPEVNRQLAEILLKYVGALT